MHASGSQGSLNVGCICNEFKKVMFECVTIIKASVMSTNDAVFLVQ